MNDSNYYSELDKLPHKLKQPVMGKVIVYKRSGVPESQAREMAIRNIKLELNRTKKEEAEKIAAAEAKRAASKAKRNAMDDKIRNVVISVLLPYYIKLDIGEDEAREQIIRDFISFREFKSKNELNELKKQYKSNEMVEIMIGNEFITYMKEKIDSGKYSTGNNASGNASTENTTNAYSILGVSKTATQGEIKTAYRKLVLKEHPNKGGDPEKFKNVQRAYEELTKKAGGRRKTRRSYKRKGTRKMRR